MGNASHTCFIKYIKCKPQLVGEDNVIGDTSGPISMEVKEGPKNESNLEIEQYIKKVTDQIGRENTINRKIALQAYKETGKLPETITIQILSNIEPIK